MPLRLRQLERALAGVGASLSSYSTAAAHADASCGQSFRTQLPPPSSVLQWNTLIRGSDSPLGAFRVFRSMLRQGFPPNNFTFPFLLKACSARAIEPHGCAAHAHIVKAGLHLDPYVRCGLMHLYSQRNDLAATRRVFQERLDEDTGCCNALIHGYVEAGELGLARGVFDAMERRDAVSWNTMIHGYAVAGDLSEARNLFARMPQLNVVSWNSMLAAHARQGDVESARKVFAEMPKRDVFSWNTMLACLARSKCADEALALFEEMKRANEKPNDATMVSLLSACSHLGALDRGKQLHQSMDEKNIKINTILATALIDMYAKCGSIALAMEIFRDIQHKDLLAWNTIIGGMAIHGHAEGALQLFNEMTNSGISPDDITFVMLLTACSHAGMVTEGKRMLDCMKDEYGIDPKVEHYGCVIDLLARAGLLEEAMELTKHMPMEPNAPTWGALLGGCKIHRNSEIADGVGKHLIHLQPRHSGRYILLSNIYATVGRWDDVNKIRSNMLVSGVAKIPGISMIELDGKVSQFVAGDQSHQQYEDIYLKLMETFERLKVEAGHLPATWEVSLDIEEEEKEQALSVHSEKLAIALGLLRTDTEATIRIFKNLRKDHIKLTSLIAIEDIVTDATSAT
ncbi:hypothetical protein ZIOFF_022993 [Zingiber officinale]|uniref:DYW domain-containing protein n=1 Tax=Zingiber officinale TaxID=94328 RepID=A0A8J5LN50_ZINOF|nr:hypothetical protein ZIOFF_022993 [Zingiber officinale]